MKKLNVNVVGGSYNVFVGSNLLSDVSQYINLNRKVLIVTDSGVPFKYAEVVKLNAKTCRIITLSQGEASKSIDGAQILYNEMLSFGMDRSDCVVAIGGGVVGDLAGFVSSTYMRGIDFYNIPTTLLSQVDSSIGGKTAINYNGVKNVIGAFYQPKAVIIDTDVLKTLSDRQFTNGLIESIKMAMTNDCVLFEMLEKLSFEDIKEKIGEVIIKSLEIKKKVVEQDERESGLRKVLNYGHTLGHAIESQNLGNLYHGECVGLGMLAISSGETRERLLKILKKIGAPTDVKVDVDKAIELIKKDKKMSSDQINYVKVDKIGEFSFEKSSVENFIKTLNF